MSTRTSPTQGYVAKGFEEVAEVFAENFKKRGEIGAACCVFYQGEKVVDLWGGIRDIKTKAPWEEDTLTIVFSSTKGMVGMALAHAHSNGLFDYDAPMANIGPNSPKMGRKTSPYAKS